MSKRNIVHVEIPAVNVEGAGKFYQDLFGWKIQPVPEMNYTRCWCILPAMISK
jgi:predicted enzyme related to lactoylglutathione lyase